MTSNITNVLATLAFLVSASAGASQGTHDTLTFSIKRPNGMATPSVTLLFASDVNTKTIDLPEFEEGEDDLKYIISVPSEFKSATLLVDKAPKYVFKKKCVLDDSMFLGFAKIGVLRDPAHVTDLARQILAETAALNATRFNFAAVLEEEKPEHDQQAVDEQAIEDRLVGAKLEKMRNDCYFGEFALTLPNRESWAYFFGFEPLKVTVGGAFAILHEGNPRVVELSLD